jgi:hypothetical protein
MISVLKRNVVPVLILMVVSAIAVTFSGCDHFTSGGCPTKGERTSTSRFASDNCLKSLFAPAPLRLPSLATYDPTDWEIDQTDGLSIGGQLVPTSRTPGPIVTFHAFALSGGEPSTASLQEPRTETIQGVAVTFDGESGFRAAHFMMDDVLYQVDATSASSANSALEAVVEPLVREVISQGP